MNQEKIGKFISQLRKENNITQEELGETLGVTSKSVSRWENGKTLPDYSLLKPLCEKLGITINELFAGEKIESNNIEKYSNINLDNILKEYYKMKKQRKRLKIILLAILLLIGYWILQAVVVTAIMFAVTLGAKVEETTDITKYNEVIGARAIEQYKSKWGMDESIFPEKIDNLDVKDFKMVYYDPWDAQYLSYLVVDYDEEDYNNEVERLEKYESTNYKGYYGVTGFSKYKLLAMNADAYQGFVYALTDEKNRIIYIELIFCNYFFDIDYNKYINKEYLPDGFDATIDNSYGKKQLK